MMESRYVTDCDCYLPEIEPLEGASVPSQADIFGVSKADRWRLSRPLRPKPTAGAT